MSYQNQESKDHLTIVIGPPGPKELKQDFEQWATNSGKSSDDIWSEFVAKLIDQITNHESDEDVSSADELFSNLLNQKVRVEEPFHTFSYRRGQRVPAFIFYAKDIKDTSGNPIQIKRFTEEVRVTISGIFGSILKSEWVHTSISFGFTS